MRMTILKTIACACLLSGVLFSGPSLAFQCQSGTVGQGSCSCSGTDDCKDMRHSKMCKDNLNCTQGKCTCTAALVADPGPTTGGDVKGTKVLKGLTGGNAGTLQKAN